MWLEVDIAWSRGAIIQSKRIVGVLTTRMFLNTPASQITPEMEEAFFSSLMVSNKTYKTTFHERFSAINASLANGIDSGCLRVTHVLDIGISSGISTVELYEDLRLHKQVVEVVGTDLLIDAILVRVYPGCDVTIEATGFPLRFDVFGHAMGPWVSNADYRSGFFLVRKLVNVILTRAAKRILARPDDPRLKRIRLATPRLFANGDIAVCVDDICRYNSAFANRFDFVRAANVLNTGYFTEATLRAMLGNIKAYLAGTGSSFLVVRTHGDRTNHGTLFVLTDRRHFEVRERFGNGSEIENTVLQL